MEEFLLSDSGILMVVGLTIVGYFLPTLIAWLKGAPRSTGIFVLNLFLGWTLLFWVGALIWAVIDDKFEK